MNDVIRTVVVDPARGVEGLHARLLGGITSLWLSDVLTSYQEAAERAQEIAAHLTIIVLDRDPNQAVDLIQKLIQANPAAIVLPASHSADSGLILKAIRAGAREFLTLPAEAAETLEMINRLVPVATSRRPPAPWAQNHHRDRRSRRSRLHNSRREPRDQPGRRQGT